MKYPENGNLHQQDSRARNYQIRNVYSGRVLGNVLARSDDEAIREFYNFRADALQVTTPVDAADVWAFPTRGDRHADAV